jgi:ABC-type antimicrobial peptide transport system permease subunit
MFSVGYLRNELRRRWGRTAVTTLGLAAGIGLVVGIIGVSDGLDGAQQRALSPLSTVGTDIIVTRTVAATTAQQQSSSASPAPGVQGGGGSSFFAPGGRAGSNGSGTANTNQVNADDQSALLNANSTVLTDLSKLGPAGTKFTHDFFVPGTLITFPQAAVAAVGSISGVQTAVPGLSLQAIHETGTVPQITDSFQTGGQTITSVQQPPPLTPAEQQQIASCVFGSAAFSQFSAGAASGRAAPSQPQPGQQSSPQPASPASPPSGSAGTGRPAGAPSEAQVGGAITKCLPQRMQEYVAKVVVPTQTITRVLNPPSTDTTSKTYTAAAVNPADRTTGLITASQVVAGTWFTSHASKDVLVNTAYASSNGIKVGQVLSINGTSFTVVGLVTPTLTGNISDLYFDLDTLQSMSTNASRVNEVLVKVSRSSDVNAVAAAIHRKLPGAQVLTAKSLADEVTGSLTNAQSLVSSFGGALAIIILVAAFLVAALLTTSSVGKRVREIGTLRAIGWTRARVVRQIIAETVGIGLLGAVLGVGIGLAVCEAVNLYGPTLTSTTSGLTVGASTASQLFHQGTRASTTQSIHLEALITVTTILLGVAFAVVGGLIAGTFGGWRASRLAPASALRDLG